MTPVAVGRGALRCAPVARGLGAAPAGTTPASAGLLLVELPLPWPSDAAEHPDLVAVAARAASTGHRVQAVVPDGATPAGHRRVVRYDRPRGPFDRYRRVEVVARADRLGAEVDDLLAVPLPDDDVAVVDVLVCTHGSRDACCGRDGIGLHRDLVARGLPGVRVWRTSHLGGHRFAPTALVLPDGHAWAWCTADDLAGILTRALPAADAVASGRGCAGLDGPWAQAADLALLGQEGWGWLDRPRPVEVGLPEEGPAGERRTVTVAGHAVVVEGAGTTPVPPCGAPLDQAAKHQLQVRATSIDGRPLAPTA